MNNNNSQFLGTREKTSRWLDKYNIKNYTINDDLSVDVNGHVNISHKNLKAIPVKFNNITGNFWCSHNKLTSLAGAPKSVCGRFVCANNQLTSLIGSPKAVGGDFHCEDNKLTSPEGSPEYIGGNFWCQNNKLINLSDFPISVDGDFWCNDNKLTSLLETINCNFKEKFFFNIDNDNFQQKELIEILKKYYNSKYEFYELTNRQFYDIIKPVLEKNILKQKLINSRRKKKIKSSFI